MGGLMKLISSIFHPLLIATYTSMLLYLIFPSIFSPIPVQSIPYFIGAVFVTTFIIPAASILLMKLTNRISSLDLTNREERIIPFVSIALFYAITTYLFYVKMNLTATIMTVMIIATALIVTLTIISLAYKISVHAAGIWGICGITCSIYLKLLEQPELGVLAFIFLVAGITSTSRLYLNRHTPAEVWLGSFVGFFFCLFGTYYFI